MRKIVEIHASNSGNIGGIINAIAQLGCDYDMKTIICSPKSKSNLQNVKQEQIFISGRIVRNLHRLFSYLTGLEGCFSFVSTVMFVQHLKKIKPDIIHLHNLHGSYINLPVLFWYLKKSNVRIIWTLHDCWAFTGHCAHFTMVKCAKWVKGCFDCAQCADYPAGRIDTSKFMWKLKRRWFCGINNMTLVTPSIWLAGLVKNSFLGKYPVEVIHNGINLAIFKPTQSDFRERYNLGNKCMILGVAGFWNKRKGLDVFIDLSQQLDENYQIVLIGTDNETERLLPPNILSIPRTKDQRELAEVYTAADLFVNPTREEVFGLVNTEALACGTPVVMFRTGGCPEIINAETGIIVECDDLEGIRHSIIENRLLKKSVQDKCIARAREFNESDKYASYMRLFLK